MLKQNKITARVIRVLLGARSYDIYTGAGQVRRLGHHISRLKNVTSVMVITNVRVASYHIRTIQSNLSRLRIKYQTHLVPDSESAKSPSALASIYHHLLRFGADRGSILVALGGGVVGDVTGFAASTYMRGIRYIQIPTTLLGQVDSAIGGKTGINLEEGKNLIGTFYQPCLIINDIALLATLNKKVRVASLAEVVKYGIIKGESFFRYLETNIENLVAGDVARLTYVVGVSAGIKARIVSRDERETCGLRIQLNLGHTFAHAFERAGAYKKISHGCAVSVGLVAAARLSELKGWVSGRFVRRVIKLLQHSGLPTSVDNLGLKQAGLLNAMEHDKKKKKGRLRFVLPRSLGKIVTTENVTRVQLIKVLKART